MKKFLALTLTLALTITATLLPAQALTEKEHIQNMKNFTPQRYYTEFSDVEGSDWFAADVASAYELGLINGRTTTQFAPDSTITIGETLALAARLNSIYYTGDCNIEEGNPWYMGYAQYCAEHGISPHYNDPTTDYNRPATRQEFATIFSYALPAYYDVNDISPNDIPDVPFTDETADIYCLYRAGVLTGNDKNLTFTPNANIQRSAVATILSRMADESKRVCFKPFAKPETKYDMPADTNYDNQVSMDEMNVVFDYLRERYPQGTPWTNDNYYGPYCGTTKSTGGFGCAAWAFLVTDCIFGHAPQYEITADELQPGDYFWTGTHFGVIMEKNGSGFYTTEGNFNSSIYWHYHRSASFFSDNYTYYSRHPK